MTLKKRANGPDVWEFRWRDASGTQRSKLIGSTEKYPAERDAQCAADASRLEINSELPKAVPITVATLVDRYFADDVEMGRLAYATRSSYKSYLNGWVKKKWGQHTLEQVRTMAIEQWLGVVALAPKSKLHLRNVLHVLFECAARWELIELNPITRVRQGGGRRSDPDVLTAIEFRALLAEMASGPHRVMVILAACLGLARSEVVGLKWLDFEWNAAMLGVKRSVVHCHIGNPKTLARRKPIPLAHELLTVLREYREQTAYSADSDWVFASPYKQGLEPYWPDSILQDFVKPAAKRAGVAKQVGWHTFRHTYSTLLRANGTDLKVQSELLRHSNISTTLNLYTQAVGKKTRSTRTGCRAIAGCLGDVSAK